MAANVQRDIDRHTKQ